MTTDRTLPDWYRLDNAAKIFPAIDSAETTTMFRLSATLNEPIEGDRLQEAVDALTPRFPYFQVELRSGLFWHFLESVDVRPRVEEEHLAPCHTVNARWRKTLLYRVLSFGHKISVEFSHIMTDGAGALAYCRALVAEYLRLGGVETEDWGDIMRPDQEISSEEYEDSYARFNDPGIPIPPALERAFQLRDPIQNPHNLRVTTGIVPIDRLLETSRAAGATMTELLSAIYIDALYQHLLSLPDDVRHRVNRPIRLVIPVNIRKIFPSRTMRNFLLHVMPGIDARMGTYTFDEILGQVHHFMRIELNEKFLKQQIARNMRGETHPLIRVTPLLIKVPAERMLYRKHGNAVASGVLSNLGAVTMPPAFDEHIERFEFITVPNPDTRLSAGVISYKDRAFITFGSLIESRDIQRRFFTSLRRRGLPVKIETN